MDIQPLLLKIIDYISDKSIGFISKSFFFFFVVFSLYFIDDYFKISHNYKLNSQLDQIGKIEIIVKDSKDSILVKELKLTEKKLLTQSEGYFSSLNDLINRQIKNSEINISGSPILHYLSSNLFLLYLLIYASRKLKKFILTKLIWFVFIIGVWIGLSFWLSGLFTSFIFNASINIYLRLFLNILFQVVIFLILYAIFNIMNKKTDEIIETEK